MLLIKPTGVNQPQHCLPWCPYSQKYNQAQWYQRDWGAFWTIASLQPGGQKHSCNQGGWSLHVTDGREEKNSSNRKTQKSLHYLLPGPWAKYSLIWLGKWKGMGCEMSRDMMDVQDLSKPGKVGSGCSKEGMTWVRDRSLGLIGSHAANLDRIDSIDN